MNLKIFNLNKNDRLYLLFVLLFSLGLIFYRTRFHMSGGLFYPDKALYLMNALVYSGLDYYNIVNPADIYYSPIISFLTSILFSFGLVDQLAISLVSSVFAIFGFIGIYILLRYRFNSMLSLTGVIIFGSISIFLINLSSGLLDVPAISISIFILLFGLVSIDQDSKYFLITFPLFVIGFFTRYTVGFMLPLLFLYFVMKRDVIGKIDNILTDKSNLSQYLAGYVKSSEFKYILLSLIISIVLFLIIIKFLILDFGGSLTFIDQAHDSINNVGYGSGGIDVVYDKLFYLKNFSNILFDEARSLDTTLSVLLYGIIIIGILFKCIDFIKKNDDIINVNWKTKNFSILLIILLVLSLIFAFISFKFFNLHLISNICVLISFTIIYSLINRNHIDKNALNILFLAYFMINFIFISINSVKTLRYALPLLPSLVYFIILGLEGLLDMLTSINNKYFNKSLFKYCIDVVPILLMIILMVSTFAYIVPMEITGPDNDLVDVADFIIDNDSNYHDETFGSNFRDSRIIRWYLQDNVTFNDDYEYFDSSNITYVITSSEVNFDNYDELYHKGAYYLYKLNF